MSLLLYLTPTGTSADTFNSGNVGGATRQAVTQDPWATPDDIVTYCQHDAQAGDGAITFDMSDIGSGYAIVSVKTKARALDVDGNPTTLTVQQKQGASLQGTSGLTSGAWTDFTTSAYTTDPTGAGWTVTNVNSLQVVVTISGIAGLSRQDLTQVGCEVTANVYNNNFVGFICSLVGPIVGVGLGEFMGILRRAVQPRVRARVALTPEELQWVYREVRERRAYAY